MDNFSEAMEHIAGQFHPGAHLVNSYVDENGETGETRATLIVAGMKKAQQRPDGEGEEKPQRYRPREPVDYDTPAFVRRNIVIEPPRTTPRRQPGGTAQA